MQEFGPQGDVTQLRVITPSMVLSICTHLAPGAATADPMLYLGCAGGVGYQLGVQMPVSDGVRYLPTERIEEQVTGIFAACDIFPADAAESCAERSIGILQNTLAFYPTPMAEVVCAAAPLPRQPRCQELAARPLG